MGSWAMNIHVRTEDVDAVIEAARAYLLTEYRPSERAPEPGSSFRIGGPLRALQVSEARNGWVSVLDSELMGAAVLSMELAARLGCYTLMVSVSDSDSWDYQLCHGQELIDAFDSGIDDASAEAIFDEIQADLDAAGLEGMDDLAELFEGMGAGELEERLLDFARQMQERLLEEMPPDLRAIEERLQRRASVSPEESSATTRGSTVYTPRQSDRTSCSISWLEEPPKTGARRRSALLGRRGPGRSSRRMNCRRDAHSDEDWRITRPIPTTPRLPG